jgi:chromosome segregation ATPase
MKTDPAAPADPLHLLRQQLILAQVRIMELEDACDELEPQVSRLEKLLAAAQTLADTKADEAAHLEKVRSGLQGQFDHLRHMQHVTNEALNACRAEVAALADREKALLSETENLQILTRELAESGREQLANIASLESALSTRDAELAAARAEVTTRLARINELDAEQRAMKASRSWRWSAWLRSLERTFGGKR